MSNLKLPDMSFDNLYKILPHDGTWKKIAYKTCGRVTGESGEPVIEIKHHETIIATIYALAGHKWGRSIVRRISLNNGGYVSRTTTHRMNEITYANTDPGKKVSVGIKNGYQEFRYHTGDTSVWYDQTSAILLP